MDPQQVVSNDCETQKDYIDDARLKKMMKETQPDVYKRQAYTTDEYLEVVGTVLKRGKRVVVAEVTISRPNGELCLKATLTSAVFDSRIIDLPRLADI